jgi:GNAT superfamily N-acetyltransferase
MKFVNGRDLNQGQIAMVNDIFFLSSAIQSFDSEEAKQSFHYKYLGYYQQSHPELLITLMLADQVIGYICGVTDSKNALELFKLQPHYHLFLDLYDQYPGHLHINVHPSFTGKGHGRLLLHQFENVLASLDVQGVHLITGPSASNRFFYSQNGYDFTEQRSFNKHELLFMAKRLKH